MVYVPFPLRKTPVRAEDRFEKVLANGPRDYRESTLADNQLAGLCVCVCSVCIHRSERANALTTNPQF
jgi:hypothetical protein